MEERRRKYHWLLAICFFVLCIVLLSSTFNANAQQPTPNLDNETLRISKGLYCPVCAGVPLDVCDTQACIQWRALIREKLAAGQTEDQIRQYFVDQYGERVLGAPIPQGFNLGIYLLPFAALVAGILVLFFTIRGWVKSRAATASLPAQAPVAPEIAERIAREMKERE